MHKSAVQLERLGNSEFVSQLPYGVSHRNEGVRRTVEFQEMIILAEETPSPGAALLESGIQEYGVIAFELFQTLL